MTESEKIRAMMEFFQDGIADTERTIVRCEGMLLDLAVLTQIGLDPELRFIVPGIEREAPSE